MKITTTSRAVLGKAAKAQAQAVESELDVPAIAVQTIHVPQPLHRAGTSAAAAPQTRSFWVDQRLTAVGALAGTASQLCVFTAGLWRIRWKFNHHFTGTSDVNGQCSLRIIEPDLAVLNIIADGHNITGADELATGDFDVLMDSDGWQVDLFRATTVAGDVCVVSGGIYATLEL